MLQVQCPKCKQPLQVGDDARGKMVRCPKCSQTLMIPAAAALAPAPRPVPPPPAASPPRPAAPPQPLPARKAAPAAPAARAPAPAQSAAPASPAGLGRQIATYGAYPFWLGLLGLVPVFVLAVILEVLAAQSVQQTRFDPQDPELPPRVVNVPRFPAVYRLHLPIAFLTLMTTGGLLFCAVQTARGLGKRVTLYENGLKYRRLGGTFDCLWSDVETVYASVDRTLAFGLLPLDWLRIETKGGEKVTVSPMIWGHYQVLMAVRRATLPQLVRRLGAQLERGERVHFGERLVISKQGVAHHPEMFDWDGVHRIVFIGLFLHILQSGNMRLRRIQLCFVGNADALAVLLDEKFGDKVEIQQFETSKIVEEFRTDPGGPWWVRQ